MLEEGNLEDIKWEILKRRKERYCDMLGFFGNMIYAPYCISIVT
jgi:hypothetical protein